MNQYRQALRYMAIGGLIVGGAFVLIGFIALAAGGGIVAAIITWIGSALFSLGFIALFFWLLAESIAHGQRALIQTLERIADPDGVRTDA